MATSQPYIIPRSYLVQSCPDYGLSSLESFLEAEIIQQTMNLIASYKEQQHI